MVVFYLLVSIKIQQLGTNVVSFFLGKKVNKLRLYIMEILLDECKSYKKCTSFITT